MALGGPETMETIRLQSPCGHVAYADSLDHFHNGVLRLLGLDQEGFEHWLAIAETERAEDLLDRLGAAYRRLNPLARAVTPVPARVEDGPGQTPGSLWHVSIADDPSVGVARSDDATLGWLVQGGAEAWRRVTEPPPPRTAARDSVPPASGKNGNARDWRAERAGRQLRQLMGIAGLKAGRVLELGATTDHFRRACLAAGLEHDAIRREATAHVQHHLEGREELYDAVTSFDFLGRVADPGALLFSIRRCLVAGGVLIIKTPNIRCPEARMFGPCYYSLRREHLVYFTAPSLKRVVGAVGLRPVQVTSISHVLVGFIGAAACAELASADRGSDLFGIFERP